MLFVARFNRALFIVALLVFVTGSATPVLEAKESALKGAFVGVGNDFVGRARPLGGFTGVFNPNDFTAVWTTLNGDTLTNQTISFELIHEVLPNVFYYEQSVMFIGGTGGFENAAGGADFIGLIDVSTGEFFGIIDGILSQD